MKYKNKNFRKIVSGVAEKVIDQGKPVEKTLSREMMTLNDLNESLREKGVDNIEDAREAYIEDDGKISILKYKEKGGSKQQDSNEKPI